MSINVEELKIKIQKAREGYRPEKIQCLFIAESPPNSIERFFYYPEVKRADYLFLGIMEILYPDLKNEFLLLGRPREIKERLLRKFQADGYYLLDILDMPLNTGGNLTDAVPCLIKKVQTASDKNTPVIIIKVTNYDLAYAPLKQAGCNVIPVRIPFPGQGQQEKFRIKFKDALAQANISIE